MAGYASDYSMSNNAVAAYSEGLRPASKIAGVPAALIAHFCRYAEWHHSSKNYNVVNFYNVEMVLATFGLQASDEYAANPAAVAALAAAKIAKKDAPVLLSNQTVCWLEWAGTRQRPTASQQTVAGCTVSVKGQTATITLPSGEIMTKRLTTKGFKIMASTEAAARGVKAITEAAYGDDCGVLAAQLESERLMRAELEALLAN